MSNTPPEIKPWVKPHLRQRLIDEWKAAQPKTVDGLEYVEEEVPAVPENNDFEFGYQWGDEDENGFGGI